MSDQWPQVDFYVFERAERAQAWRRLCQLLAKCYQSKQQAYLHAPSQDVRDDLDRLLWTYQDDSFIPHSCDQDQMDCPILLGCTEPPTTFQGQVLFNLTTEVPSYHTRFQRIIEIIYQDADIKAGGRQRYRQYQQNQCEIRTHRL